MTTGADVGGTFTDVVHWDGRRLSVAKTSSTPDQSNGVVTGIRLASPAIDDLLVHGTTVATNALLERAGAVTALVTNAGYEDLIEIARQDRPSLYDPEARRPEPPVPRHRRFGWNGDATTLMERLSEQAPAAVAISLLYSFRDPDVEEELARLVGAALPEALVTLSAVVSPEFREYERTSTTAVNAYLMPAVGKYLLNLSRRVVPDLAHALRVMRSSGGLMTPETASVLPVAILLSGPAGGVVAAAELGRSLGSDRVISFDMGGTSTDVCRIEGGRPEITYGRTFDGLAVRMPTVAVHTVGAGGGSLGWVDPGGALRVGPRSAGAWPGPASYGRGGTQAAVTDANLALGRVDPNGLLAGSVALDPAAARTALAELGADISLDPVGTARGMLEVVEATMERAIRAVSVQEGADPRRAVLVSFGGAGGLHATALARRLGMRSAVVPPHAGVFSALGLLLSPPRFDSARSVLLRSPDGLDRAIEAVADRARRGLEESTGRDPIEIETMVDVRYVGQSHETTVDCAPGEGWNTLASRFHDAHRARNGFARTADPIEAVTVRAAAVGRPALRWDQLPRHRPIGEAMRSPRSVHTGREWVEAAVWWRPGMSPGSVVRGPAVIEEPESTTYLAPGDVATLDDAGSLILEWT